MAVTELKDGVFDAVITAETAPSLTGRPIAGIMEALRQFLGRVALASFYVDRVGVTDAWTAVATTTHEAVYSVTVTVGGGTVTFSNVATPPGSAAEPDLFLNLVKACVAILKPDEVTRLSMEWSG